MIQRFTSLPLALKVLISAVVLGVLLILAMGTPAMIAKTFERFSGFIGTETPQQAGAPGNEYLSMVEEIQTGSVDSFLQSDEKFSRFDSLTPGDVEVMKTDYNTLGEYLNRADNLDPLKDIKTNTSYSVLLSPILPGCRAGLLHSCRSQLSHQIWLG